MEFDSFELERLQLKQHILQRAKKLLDEGKNLTQAAKILRSENLRVTYDQLIKWVRAGHLEDKFKAAQDIAEKLFHQGLDIENITEQLQKSGYNYTKQWVGRWISEGGWGEDPTLASTVSSDIVMPPEVPKKIPELSENRLVEVLSKISGYPLTESDLAIPEAWRSPVISSTGLNPISMLSYLLNTTLEPKLESYFAKKVQDREKPRIAVEILEVLARDLVINDKFDKEIAEGIAGTKFTPIQLVTNFFGLSEDLVRFKISEIRKAMTVEPAGKKYPAGVPLDEILSFVTGQKKFSTRLTKEIAQEKILGGIRSYKLLTLADFIRLLPVPQPWPNQEDLKVYEEAWKDIVRDTDPERGERLILIDKFLIRVTVPTARTLDDFVSRLKVILQDIIDNSFRVMTDEVNYWNFLFLLLINAQKATDDKNQPLTRAELAEAFGGEKVIPNTDGFIDRVHEAKLLLRKEVKGVEYYEVNRTTLMQRLNTYRNGYYNLKIWDVPSVSHPVSLFEALRELPGANEPCVCGSGKKFKKCHKDLFN